MQNKLQMKTPSANEFKRFDEFVREIVRVPKEDIKKREIAEKNEKNKQRKK